MLYIVTKLPVKKKFAVTRIISEEEICPIGLFDTRKEAILCARLLAGWRGTVSVKV